jgi:serine/threonine-protein kinase
MALPEDLAADQAKRWQEGRPKMVREYLAERPELARDPEALADLVLGEIVQRKLRGLPVVEAEYLDLVPEHREYLKEQLAGWRILDDQLASWNTTYRPQSAAEDDGGLNPGDRLGPYELQELLAWGGMGEVWRVVRKDDLMGDVFALKVIRRNVRDAGSIARAEALERFIREARLVKKVNHVAGVVPLVASGKERGIVYYAMPLLDGSTLRAVLGRDKRLSPRFAAKVVYTLAGIVHAVHQAGVVHRDIKPENVILGSDETVHLIDFGIAVPAADNLVGQNQARAVPRGFADAERLTSLGRFVGTPLYMAPERFSGPGGDTPTADVFSLGAMLWEFLAGSWSGREWESACRGQLDPEPLFQAGVPGQLVGICQRALAADPSERFASAVEFGNRLGIWVRMQTEPRVIAYQAVVVPPPFQLDRLGEHLLYSLGQLPGTAKLCYAGFFVCLSVIIVLLMFSRYSSVPFWPFWPAAGGCVVFLVLLLQPLQLLEA